MAGTVNHIGDQSFSGNLTPSGRVIVPMGEIGYVNMTGTLVTISALSDGSTNLVKAAPVTALSAGCFQFDNGGADNGRLRYTGATTKMFHCAVTVSFDGEGAGTNVYVFAITKNGVAMSGCKVLQSIAAVGDIQSTALHCMAELATNDYIELYVGNTTDTDDITIKSMNIFALGM